MKKYIYILFASLGLLVSSCDEDVIVYDTPEGFVQLNATSGTVTEDTPDPVVTTVLLGKGANESGVSVNFTVTSSDPSRYTVTPSSGTLDIPAGEFSADIVLQTIDNPVADGDVEVTIEISSASVPIGIGGEENFNTSRTITIVDDDCPINLDAFTGTFTVTENFTDGVNAPLGLADFFGESYQIELAPAPNDPSGTKVVITNSPGFNEYIADGTVITFLTCSGKVLFEGGFPTVALFATFEYTDSSYDDTVGELQCTGPLQNFGPYQFTFTKQ